jgi:ABC-type lipoprotein release transport system permease subunit
MQSVIEFCERHIRWSFIVAGAAIGLTATFLIATVIGAIIGIPLMLLAFSLLNDPVERIPCSAV